ncbi:MAG: acetyl-CoA C-acetyltransferase [Pseudomonadota bacterium]
MPEVVIAGACRTAIGTFGGMFKSFSAVDLGAVVLKEAVRRAGIEPGRVEEVIFGNCMMRSDELTPARTLMLKAGLPFSIPAMTIQRQCASGMQAIVSGFQQIMLGEHEIVACGGTENMSNLPYVIDSMRWGARLGDARAIDMLVEALTDPIHKIHMGITAENLAEKHGISREAQDELAHTSQMRATAAIKEGRFKEEIVPVEIQGRKGKATVCDTDEHPRPDTTLETLARLQPAFKKGGTVTAGNASGINDGAACLIIMSDKKAAELGVKPMARIVDHQVAAVEPELMGYGPVPAVKKLLERQKMKLEDISLIELNEAFAAQYLACEKLLGLDRKITNVNGSGIALGHPVGATGARITVSLLYEMKRRGLKTGLATLCVGGGMGKALLVEML